MIKKRRISFLFLCALSLSAILFGSCDELANLMGGEDDGLYLDHYPGIGSVWVNTTGRTISQTPAAGELLMTFSAEDQGCLGTVPTAVAPSAYWRAACGTAPMGANMTYTVIDRTHFEMGGVNYTVVSANEITTGSGGSAVHYYHVF